jgi:hypothetical protein
MRDTIAFDIYSAIADLVDWFDGRKPNTLRTKIKCGMIDAG